MNHCKFTSLQRIAKRLTANGSFCFVHVDEVDRGMKCNCFCIVCNEKLIAKKGKKIAHHFSHQNGSDCSITKETLLHKIAKKVIIDYKELTIPNILNAEVENIKMDSVTIEKKITCPSSDRFIVVDAYAEINKPKSTHRLIIEIFVTHKCDEDKKDKIKEIGISCIEIDLSEKINEIKSPDSPDELKQLEEKIKNWVTFESSRYWIYNKKEDDIKKENYRIYQENIRKMKINFLNEFDNYIEKGVNIIDINEDDISILVDFDILDLIMKISRVKFFSSFIFGVSNLKWQSRLVSYIIMRTMDTGFSGLKLSDIVFLVKKIMPVREFDQNLILFAERNRNVIISLNKCISNFVNQCVNLNILYLSANGESIIKSIANVQSERRLEMKSLFIDIIKMANSSMSFEQWELLDPIGISEKKPIRNRDKTSILIEKLKTIKQKIIQRQFMEINEDELICLDIQDFINKGKEKQMMIDRLRIEDQEREKIKIELNEFAKPYLDPIDFFSFERYLFDLIVKFMKIKTKEEMQIDIINFLKEKKEEREKIEKQKEEKEKETVEKNKITEHINRIIRTRQENEVNIIKKTKEECYYYVGTLFDSEYSAERFLNDKNPIFNNESPIVYCINERRFHLFSNKLREMKEKGIIIRY